MKSEYRCLGDVIGPVDRRNKDLSVSRLLGVNVDKEFMPSVANVIGTDLSRYKILERGTFACNLMHVGRDERVPIAFYEEEASAIVSPAYTTFKVVAEDVLPEFLMINFRRSEFDRYAGYLCDSSIRGGLDWDRFCNIELPMPRSAEQKRYVDLYNALRMNLWAYENGLEDLQVISDTFLQDLFQRSQAKRLGNYIRQVDVRNTNSEIRRVQGISINKTFIDSKANMEGVSLHSYKVVKPRQFAYVTVTSRNGDKISIALLRDETCVVSSTYCVFEVIDPEELIPEFLYLWFTRAEFDRYARFHSWGSARETFDWSAMCDVKLPIPNRRVQQSIVEIHHVLEVRKQLKSELKSQFKEICPVLVRGVAEGLA